MSLSFLVTLKITILYFYVLESLRVSTFFFRYSSKPVKGLEPPTYGLQIRCSTIELHQHWVLSEKLNYLNLFYRNILLESIESF